jgi:OCT family organic cation transporter-like MFS transporter 4/5
MAFNSPLICNREELGNLLQSIVYFGSLVGFFIFSFIADNYGRKLGLGISWFTAFLGAVFIGVIL